MIYQRVFAVVVNARDASAYSMDPERYLMNHLRGVYEARCYMGAHILRVLRIVNRSQPIINDGDITAHSHVNVEFAAEVSTLGRWDVLGRVVISVLSPQFVAGESVAEGLVTASLGLDRPEARILQEGQTVAIRVLKSRYPPFQDSATVAGNLLVCESIAPVGRVEAPLTPREATGLKPLLGAIRELLARRAKLLEARRDDLFFFEVHLYAYRFDPPPDEDGKPRGIKVRTEGAADWEGPLGVPAPPGAEAVNLLEYVERVAAGEADAAAPALWCRDLSLHRSAPLALRAPASGAEAAPAGWVQPVADSAKVAFERMLMSVYNFLLAVEEMARMYSTRDELTRHKNVWAVMRRAQKPAP